jgi:hypothetical protein
MFSERNAQKVKNVEKWHVYGIIHILRNFQGEWL